MRSRVGGLRRRSGPAARASAARPAPGCARGARPSRRRPARAAAPRPWPSGLYDWVDDAVLARGTRAARRGRGRVELDLVDVGRDPGRGEQPLEVRGLEVRDADRADAALLEQRGEPAPGVDVAVLVGVRPVDQVQIEVVDAELVACSSRRPRAPRRTPCHSALSLVVTNSSSRGTPARAQAARRRRPRCRTRTRCRRAGSRPRSRSARRARPRRRPSARCRGRAAASTRRAGEGRSGRVTSPQPSSACAPATAARRCARAARRRTRGDGRRRARRARASRAGARPPRRRSPAGTRRAGPRRGATATAQHPRALGLPETRGGLREQHRADEPLLVEQAARSPPSAAPPRRCRDSAAACASAARKTAYVGNSRTDARSRSHASPIRPWSRRSRESCSAVRDLGVPAKRPERRAPGRTRRRASASSSVPAQEREQGAVDGDVATAARAGAAPRPRSRHPARGRPRAVAHVAELHSRDEHAPRSPSATRSPSPEARSDLDELAPRARAGVRVCDGRVVAEDVAVTGRRRGSRRRRARRAISSASRADRAAGAAGRRCESRSGPPARRTSSRTRVALSSAGSAASARSSSSDEQRIVARDASR